MTTAPAPRQAPPEGPRTTRRREQTRTRLLAAALDLLAEQGLARTSVEGVCERAGFTRGAFYSNFASTDEVVAALFAQQAARVLEHVRSHLPGTGGTTGLPDLVARVLELLPVDRQWLAVRAEFSAQALRDPAAARILTTAREELLAQFAPLLDEGLDRAGRTATAPATELARAVLAAHEGATSPAAGGTGRAFEVRLLTAVLEAFSAPATAPAATGAAR
ncbi:TetR/AcrR family transcriptional regulator [Paenibacillus sp. TRM 82003]|uniref:TetR/AcrR family transcriptional regulator n=1 Tax=Kineococcus sp. TRM81007 TaxID=2925831 RepID=UPI001F58C479|nr:TetR/AcrR family transcriptional regulator [Kineococcus sp. TRM81007]MCI2239585.1 TetR/AcrR family transcriptional regulator [Kineococcus sp. TRM81007]MCI3926133.1 TetR/AcrR family transcriptional regulator [Paenibacillus sp. TRM 82003]